MTTYELYLNLLGVSPKFQEDVSLSGSETCKQRMNVNIPTFF